MKFLKLSCNIRYNIVKLDEINTISILTDMILECFTKIDFAFGIVLLFQTIDYRTGCELVILLF